MGNLIRRNGGQVAVAKVISLRLFGNPEQMSVAWLLGKAQEPFIGLNRADEANDEYRLLCGAMGVNPKTRWTDA